MNTRVLHRLNLLLMLALGGVWAGALVVLGALLASGDLSAGSAWPSLRPLATALGVCFMAAGLFVFAVIVADRLFPGAARGVTTLVETALGLVMVGSVAAMALTIATGAAA